MDWQPIETAPTNNTRVLIFMPDGSPQIAIAAQMQFDGDPDGMCWYQDGDSGAVIDVDIAAWLPLIPPPFN